MSSKCQSCGVVGLTENDVHLSEEILGEGWETMCIECARGIQRHNETHHQCIYCEEEIEGENVVPRNETEWDVESKKHRKDCEWVLTRAHTLPKHKYTTSALGAAIDMGGWNLGPGDPVTREEILEYFTPENFYKMFNEDTHHLDGWPLSWCADAVLEYHKL